MENMLKKRIIRLRNCIIMKYTDVVIMNEMLYFNPQVTKLIHSGVPFVKVNLM